jgi:type II secretory pathway predicted ATPase ExeA
MPRKITHNFVIGLPVSGDSFVDRTQILRDVGELFSLSTGNILITGKRRAGKTSLCLKLREVARQTEHVMTELMSMDTSFEQPEFFTQAVLLRVIRGIAATLYSKKYSELLADLTKPKRSNYGQLLRLFDLARRGSSVASYTFQKEVGASALAQAKLVEIEKNERSLSRLSSVENLLLLEEVVELLRQQQISRFVLFVDEANKLTLEANSGIIRDNLALFSAQGMQFCFVTTPEVVAAAPAFQELFQHRVDVGAFDTIDAVNSLIQSCCNVDGRKAQPEEVFSTEAVDAIWRISRGIPFKVQQLCQRSLKKVLASGGDRVALNDILDVVSQADVTEVARES